MDQPVCIQGQIYDPLLDVPFQRQIILMVSLKRRIRLFDFKIFAHQN